MIPTLNLPLRRSSGTKSYHGVNIGLFVLVENGHEHGLLSVAAHIGGVEVDYVSVVVVVTDVLVLPPAWIGATVGSWPETQRQRYFNLR